MTPRTPLQRWLIDPLEYALLATVFAGLRCLSPEQASNFCGWVARTIGPRLPVANRARRNLALALPELGLLEHEAIVAQVFDNFGRIFGEMPHMRAIAYSARVEVPPEDLAMVAALKAEGQALIFAGAHFSNFEVFGETAVRYGYPMALIYRRANNPLVDALFRRMRGEHLTLLPKGLEGFRAVRKVMADGGNLGILIDQKLNEGVAAPFFDRPAMTTTAPAQMASRYKAPIVMGWVERLGPARYRIALEAVAMPQPTDSTTKARRAAEHALTEHLNRLVEARVRANPGAWFWLHRRWPESKGPWPDPALPPKPSEP